MAYYAYIDGSKDRTRTFESASAAWEHLIDVHEGRLRKAGKHEDRVLRRMEARSDVDITGIVSGVDPQNTKRDISYSVQDW